MARLANVNTTDIADAIRLGCRRMHRVNADDLHNGGRYLNALLHAEEILGVSLDEDYVTRMADGVLETYGGPVPLPARQRQRDGSLVDLFDPHNTREGFHGLYALARYRQSSRALKTADACIQAVFEFWTLERGWDEAQLNQRGVELGFANTYIRGAARAIGPLVKLYRATGLEQALELAIVLKEKAIAEFFTEEGAFDGALFGHHVHSTTSTLSGLALLADLTADSHLLDRVKAFYDNGLWDLRDDVGWAIETVKPEDNPDSGETNSSGDILEAALVLGKWGHTEYYHDAERILRCHLLPTQMRDGAFLIDRAEPGNAEATRQYADDLLGAYGFPAPYGHDPADNQLGIRFNRDVVGGTVDSLCCALWHVATADAAGHRVNLLFDHESDFVKVESAYAGQPLRVTPKKASPLFVRLPPWVDAQSLGTQGGNELGKTNGYLFFSEPAVGEPINIEYPLASSALTLKHRTREIRVQLNGDAVAAMENLDQDLTYFDAL